MNEDRDIDITTFRKSRLERFREWRRNRIIAVREGLQTNRPKDLRDWRRGRVLKFREWRKDFVGRFTQRGWNKAEAEVVSCTAIRHPLSYSSREVPFSFGGWAVNFKYTAGGKSYDGVLPSMDEVQPGDRFTIRYNPERPDENDTIASKLDCLDGPIVAVYDALLVLFFASLVVLGIVLEHHGH